MGKLLTQSQFARRIKLSPGRISQLVKQQVILLINGRVDPHQAERAIRDNVDRSRRLDLKQKRKSRVASRLPKSTPSNRERTLIEVRRDNEVLKGELLAIKLKIEQGELVPKGESIQWLSSMVAVAKSAFWNMPRRMGEILSLIADPKEVELQLRKEIRIILEQLAEPLTEKQWTEALEKEGEDPEFEEQLRLKREKGAPVLPPKI